MKSSCTPSTGNFESHSENDRALIRPHFGECGREHVRRFLAAFVARQQVRVCVAEWLVQLADREYREVCVHLDVRRVCLLDRVENQIVMTGGWRQKQV